MSLAAPSQPSNKTGGFFVPIDFNALRNWYCCLRIEKRNKTKTRFYYRKISKEKIRLAELGYCQTCIIAYARNLAKTRPNNFKSCELCMMGIRQLDLFNFT